MAAPSPAIPCELVEEILLRVPPDDPALLVRATLVCKQWRRLVCGPGFRCRFREFHRTPPLPGFLGNIVGFKRPCVARFVPTSSFRPPRANLSDWVALHSCHGRVLFSFSLEARLLVWDLMTDEQRELPMLSWCPYQPTASWNAAVLCASSAGAGCNHLDCHRGPFLVDYVGTFDGKTVSCLYSSEADAWSEPTSMSECCYQFHYATKALAGNALYLNNARLGTKLLKYDLITGEMSVIQLPAEGSRRHIVLMAVEDGRLGFATVQENKLYLWSWKVGPDGDARWSQKAVSLNMVCYSQPVPSQPNLVWLALQMAGSHFYVDESWVIRCSSKVWTDHVVRRGLLVW